MLSFSRNSQCYRFASFANDYHVSENLCPYVRQIIKGFGLFTLLWTVISAEVVGLLFAIATLWNFGWEQLFTPSQGAYAAWLTMSFVIFLIALGLFCVAAITAATESFKRRKANAYIAEFGREAWDRLRYEPRTKSRPPSVFREWLRAKHDKICPRIEFK